MVATIPEIYPSLITSLTRVSCPIRCIASCLRRLPSRLTLAKWETVSGQFGGYLSGHFNKIWASGCITLGLHNTRGLPCKQRYYGSHSPIKSQW
jgi:hypothetical protein